MESEQVIWERALIKAGVWPKRCEHPGYYIHYHKDAPRTPIRLCAIHNKADEHTIAAPAIGDAEATVKLLEWLLRANRRPELEQRLQITLSLIGRCVMVRVGWNDTNTITRPIESTLPLALAAAVLGVQE